MLSNRQKLGIILLFLSDIVILFFIVTLAVAIRQIIPKYIPGLGPYILRPGREWWLLLVWFGILMYEGAYTKKFTFWDEVRLLWKVSFFSTLAILTIVSLGQFYTVSRIAILLIGLSSNIFFPLLRITVKRSLVRAGLLKSKVLIVGVDDMGKRTLHAL